MKEENGLKTTLVVMAAGMGSRYGGLKQMDSFGPGGESILEYSIYDAKLAGFDEVVFIIKKEHEELFKEKIGRKIEERMAVQYVFQDIHDIPAGFQVPENRIKPWGTGHAVYSARNAVKNPFCVINADDYYGKEAFQLIHDYLSEQKRAVSLLYGRVYFEKYPDRTRSCGKRDLYHQRIRLSYPNR
jgi:dTDP-glucose pyrophosphorylase